jgi:hypothetical protein
MHENTETTPFAFTVTGAASYSGLTRTFLYENRAHLDWIKAGRRSLITRESLDRLLLKLLHRTRAAAGIPNPARACGPKSPTNWREGELPVDPISKHPQLSHGEPTDEEL